MESDLPKGYRGAAERSSNVGVPALSCRNGHRGGGGRSSKVGVQESEWRPPPPAKDTPWTAQRMEFYIWDMTLVPEQVVPDLALRI